MASIVVFAIVALCSTKTYQTEVSFLSQPPAAQESPVEDDPPGREQQKKRKSRQQTSQGIEQAHRTEVSLLSQPPAQDSPGREQQKQQMKRKQRKQTSHDGHVHFIEPGSQLHELVQKWKEFDIPVSQAALDLDKVISDDDYIGHKPSEGMLFIKTHKTGAMI